MKILVVEDNNTLRENLVFLLKKSGFVAESAENGKVAITKISNASYNAVILDVNMPVMNGKEFLGLLKASRKNIPVIALTSNSLLEDKLELFDLGVVDYMTKPFEIKELVARLKVLVKRGVVMSEDVKNLGNISIDYHKRIVSMHGKVIDLPHKQYLIIEYLSTNRGYPKSKLKIMEYVWGEAEENLEMNSTTLESHIYAIRKKLGRDFIKTRKGVGYIIE